MTETVRYDASHVRRAFVRDDAGLGRAVKVLAAAPVLGVDLEMVQRVKRHPGGRQEWSHVLALIQIASDTDSYVIDPLAISDLSPLGPLMAGNSRKVFLGGGQDVSLLEKAGIPARNIADVGEVALALYGRREDGMAAIARRIFNLHLDKTVRRADWSLRPLNPTLLAYAHQDAEITLAIYHWFREHHADVLAIHERAELEPGIPAGTAQWLSDAFAKPSGDALAVALEHDKNPKEHENEMAEDVRYALSHVSAPRAVNRLIRIATDLELRSVAGDLASYTTSPVSLVRISAARALGRIGERDAATPVLESLLQDSVEEVRKSAEVALKDLAKERKREAEVPVEDDEESSLDDEARSALQRLLASMSERHPAD